MLLFMVVSSVLVAVCVQRAAFVHHCGVSTPAPDVHREGCPYDFLRSAPANSRPTEGSPERLRLNETGPAPGPSHGQNRRCTGCQCTPRRALIEGSSPPLPAMAHGRRRARQVAPAPGRAAWLLAALVTAASAHAPKADNISQTPYRRKAAVFASLEDGTAVLFSGKTKDERVNNGHMAYVGDTWLFTPGPASFWRRLHFGDERNARPGPRWKSAGDGVNGNLYIFGGHVEHGSHSVYYDDMWALEKRSTWREIPKGEVWPPARRGHAAAHADDLLVIVGGRQHHSECLRDAWAFNITSEVWRKTSTPPKGSGYGCRWGHSATAIPPIPTAKDGSVQSEHTVAVFGGRQKTKKSYDYHDSSVWVYSPKWDAWRELNGPADAARPQARDHHAAAYLDGALYIHGGKVTDQATSANDDLWRFDFVTHIWQQLSYDGKVPRSRYLHSACSWPSAPRAAPAALGARRGAVLLFGGEHIKSRRNGKKKYVRFDDVWGYWAARAPTDGTWVRLVDNAGGTKEPVLSPFALVGVRVASAVLVVLLSLGVVALGLFHRFSQQSMGGTSSFESGACAGDAC